MAGFQGSAMPQTTLPPPDDVVEIGLLLPKNWAKALIELSKRRQQSVGQILRHLIGRALTDEAIQDH
jgi:hypothetical protein